MRRKIKLGLAGLNATKIIEKATLILTKMTGNANFPDPTPSLADLTAANEALSAANAAAASGDRAAITVRKNQEQVVANMLRTLAAYITMASDGNDAVIQSSGFELQNLPEPQPNLSRPVAFKSLRGQHQGDVELSWRRVRGAMSYLIEMTTGEPSNPNSVWTTVAITTKVKVGFSNLGIGNFYYYRVKGVGRNNESAWSDISMVMTAA